MWKRLLGPGAILEINQMFYAMCNLRGLLCLENKAKHRNPTCPTTLQLWKPDPTVASSL